MKRKALLFTTIRNLYIDQYRRNQLVVFEAFNEETQGVVDLPPEIDVASSDLDAALQKLKPEEREAIYLNAVEGYTAREISDLTNRPRNTVLSHIHRGKQKLVHSLSALINRRKYL